MLTKKPQQNNHLMFQSHRKSEMTAKRDELVRKGWVPPHGERQYNLLHDTAVKKGLAMQGPRHEHLMKKRYLEEIVAGKYPNYK